VLPKPYTIHGFKYDNLTYAGAHSEKSAEHFNISANFEVKFQTDLDRKSEAYRKNVFSNEKSRGEKCLDIVLLRAVTVHT
jgi:hypothetical protein